MTFKICNKSVTINDTLVTAAAKVFIDIDASSVRHYIISHNTTSIENKDFVEKLIVPDIKDIISSHTSEELSKMAEAELRRDIQNSGGEC